MAGEALNTISGTTAFNPSLGEATLYAFGMCGLRRTQLTAQHLFDARTAANLVLSDWANDQPNLWTVDLQTIAAPTFQQGVSTYSVPASTILILDAYLTVSSGGAAPIDLYMFPISRTEWAAFPDKTSQGRPTVYWFDRLIAPTVTLWQPPSNASWIFNYYRVRQMDDANLDNAGTIEIPYYFLKAFVTALAAELAPLYAPERAIALEAKAEKVWMKARNRNRESVPLYITPGLTSYHRIR